MKKLFLFILFVSFNVVANSANRTVSISHNIDSLQHQMLLTINNLQELAARFDKYQKDIQNLQQDRDNLKTANEELSMEKERMLNDLSSQMLCKMLFEYPLSQKYDSSLVIFSLDILNKYGMKEKHPDLWKIRYPALENYAKHNEEIYKLIAKYIMFKENNIPSSSNAFQDEYRSTNYYREKNKKNGIWIPYLDQQINKVINMYRNNAVSAEQLNEVARSLKK